MDTKLQLNEGEKLILESRPLDNLLYYSTFNGVFVIGVIVGIVLISMIYVLSQAAPNPSAMDLASIASTHKWIKGILLVYLIYVGLIYWSNTITVPQYRYIFTDQRCIIYSGFIGVNKRVIPYNRIADVNIQQGTVEALFKLSTVFIDEQAMNYSQGTWIGGLSINDADEITKIISQHITKMQR
jgi:membrane protein YdbS with pleckstrin-like domain